MSLSHDDLVALATAVTGLLAVPIAIAAFFGERYFSARRRQEGSKVASLTALTIVGLYAGVSDGVGWWAWLQATSPSDDFLFGLSRSFWFAALFVPPLIFAAVCGIGGTWGLISMAIKSARSSPP
jgi:hypothetical protein